MASNESRSPARPEPPRVHLTSPWTLLGIAVAVGVTLVLIFPGRGLISQTTKGGPANEVGITYLNNLAKSEPQNPDLRFSLAQKETQAGKIGEARRALEPLYNSPDPRVRQKARREDLRLRMQERNSYPAGSPERAKATESVRQEVVAMSQYEQPPEARAELAEIADQLGDRKLRADILLQSAKDNPAAASKYTDEAATILQGGRDYRGASQAYFEAMQRAQTREEKRRYFMAGVKALQAGNMPREALAAAERNLGDLGSDDEMLRFMIRLAQAANEPARAQVYARRLMRMSDARALLRWLQAIADALVPAATAAEPEPRSTAAVMSGMRPYNAQDYKLAYDVFIGNGAFDDAYRVAAAAVQQVPNDLSWRERLAQVSEWSNRSNEALQQWLYIARRTGRPAAWEAVLRIAPGLFDDEALLEAMRYQATRRPLNDAQWAAVVDAYERVGRPREAVTLLEREYARRPRPIFLELQAQLLDRMGDLDGAIAAYRRLIQVAGPTTSRVTTLSTMLIQRGDYKEAYDLLQANRERFKEDDAEYWRLLADLALNLQEDVTAERALEVLTKSPKAEPNDYNRLIALLQPREPVAAAKLAEAGYARFKTTDYLVLALGIYSDRRDFASMRRVFGLMTPEVEAELAKSPDFLMLRAEYRIATGHPDLGREDYRQALRIDPNHRLARIGFMWFLIDRRELDELRLQLAAAVKQGKDDPQFEGVIGAAFLTLGDSARAVQYFARVLKRNPDDYLWLMNYADALEQDNQPDMAWRVRRHAWIKVRQEMAKTGPNNPPPLDLLQAQARLVTMSSPGDASLAAMRNLMRQDQSIDAPSNDPMRRRLDTGTRDLVLSWTISTEQWIAAKAWLWKQYARDLAKPTWAEAIIALQYNDVETLQRLLDTQPDAIPRYDRHDAAERTQEYRFAQTIAFDELARRPFDDEMHLRLTGSVLNMYNSVEVGPTWFRRGAVSGREDFGEVAVWLSPRLRLSLDVTHIEQDTRDPTAIAAVPRHDTAYGMTLLFRHAIGDTRFSVWYRNALRDFAGASLSYGRPLGPRMIGRIGLAYNERALETSALAVGGVRDRAFIDMEYNLSHREYVLGELSASRYYTQDRTFIGSGQSLAWEAGHRFRVEYPDWHVRVAGSFNNFNQSGSGDVATAVLVPGGGIPSSAFFLPPSFSVYGVYTGFGTFYRTNYTRAIRPFVDVGISHNTVTGQGYGAILGASGSLLGHDRLTLYASTGRGGTGVNETTREVGLRYMYMFDRF